MIRESDFAKAVVYAYKKGYRVIDGHVMSPYRDTQPLILSVYGNPGYYTFSIRHNKRRYKVRVHQLIAYQKFGKKALSPGIQVRHMDDNRLNNRYSNIRIGSASDNSMDRPSEQRQEQSNKAASKRRKYSDEQIGEMRRLHGEGWSYKQLMEKFNISSKGTMSNIINNDYTTTKE